MPTYIEEKWKKLSETKYKNCGKRFMKVWIDHRRDTERGKKLKETFLSKDTYAINIDLPNPKNYYINKKQNNKWELSSQFYLSMISSKIFLPNSLDN